MVRLVVALLAALSALVPSCSGPGAHRLEPPGATGSGSGSGSAAAAALDPWAAGAGEAPDEPPGFAATRALADRACPKVAAPYFYRLEKAGKASHILGTRHLGVSLDKMPANVRQAIRAASVAVFEVAPGDDAPRATPQGPALSVQLGPELWQRYRKLVGRATADRVEHGSPTEAMVMMLALYEHKLAALDTEIEQMVVAARIPTKGLESAAFQQRLLVELLDVRMLRATVAGTPDRATLERESVRDLTEYCAGTDEQPGMDGEARAQLRAGGYSDTEIDRLDQVLVYDRNTDWIPKLEQIMAGGGAFIAVGSDHLTGPRGVVALLRARGWTATRLPP
jgi:uncharacterized protein YbaP (TraB family)